MHVPNKSFILIKILTMRMITTEDNYIRRGPDQLTIHQYSKSCHYWANTVY